MNTEGPKGVVLNIQHFSTDDGPGIRTTVFLKGCSFRCKWCCNPESIHFQPELAYRLNKCIGEKECGLCLKECPESAIYVMPSDGKMRINWDLCTNCGKMYRGLSSPSAGNDGQGDDGGRGTRRGRAGCGVLPRVGRRPHP